MKIVKTICFVSILLTICSCGGEDAELVVEKDDRTIEELVVEVTPPKFEVSEEIVEAKPILFIAESSSLMPTEVKTKMEAAFAEIMALMSVAKIEMTSPPMSISTLFSMAEMKCEFNAAIVAEIPEGMDVSGRIEKGETYAGKALKTIHVGSLLKLKSTYDALTDYIKDNGYEINGNSWEEFIDDPKNVSQEELRINIYFPVK